MKRRNYSTEGIILALKDYSEADRIIVVFTKDFGKITLIAKGVRKLTSRKRGYLEVFNRIKFSAVKSKGLDIILEAETINSFPKIRRNLKKVSVGYYFCEVIGRSTKDEGIHKDLYLLILDYFSELEKTDNLKMLRTNFIKDLLVILGFWPKEKKMLDADRVLKEVIEREINSSRVGKRILE